MAYVRPKRTKGRTYYYLVEGKRDENGKMKQKVLCYLGNAQRILDVFSFWKTHR